MDGVPTDYYTDFLGRITRTICPTASVDWLYTYAPTGDRMKKANLLTPFNSEHYLPSDGDTLCDFTTSGGSEVETGVYVSPGVDGRVARIDPTKGGSDPLRTTYYFGDALQSVLQVTDAAGLEIRKQFTDAWGNDIAGVGSGSSGNAGDRYGFTGRENDAESGLMHYRARSYDPMTGRFTSRDPVPYSNLYCYVQNNPVNLVDLVDPSGMYSKEEWRGMAWSELNAEIHDMLARWAYSKKCETEGSGDANCTEWLLEQVELGQSEKKRRERERNGATASVESEMRRRAIVSEAIQDIHSAAFAAWMDHNDWGSGSGIEQVLDQAKQSGVRSEEIKSTLELFSTPEGQELADLAEEDGVVLSVIYPKAGSDPWVPPDPSLEGPDPLSMSLEQPRGSDGKWTTGDGDRPGHSAEKDVWSRIAKKPGWEVRRGGIRVVDAEGKIRVYDGAARMKGKGAWIGLEIKSGSARKTASQRGFDSRLGSSSSPLRATGANKDIEIRKSVEIKVPSRIRK